VSRTTLQQLGFALAIGLVVSVSPFTPGGLGSKLVTGSAVAALVIGVRALRRTDVDEPAESDDAAALPSVHVPPLFWASALAFFAVFLPTGVWLYGQWTSSVWNNGHGLFTPIAMAYIGYGVLRRDTSREAESSSWGYAVLGLGLALLVLDTGIETKFLSAIALVICLPGISLLLLGARRTQALALPLMIGIFMIPVPDNTGIHLLLRQLTAAGVEPLLQLFELPYDRDQTVFLMRGVNFHVSDACSGFATLYAAVAISAILTVHTRPLWRAAMVLLVAVPLALFANILRIFVLMVLTQLVNPTIMDTQVHPASGVATFLLIACVMFLVAGRKAVRRVIA
jgi:exosortase